MKQFAVLPQIMKRRLRDMKRSLDRLHVFFALKSRQKKWGGRSAYVKTTADKTGFPGPHARAAARSEPERRRNAAAGQPPHSRRRCAVQSGVTRFEAAASVRITAFFVQKFTFDKKKRRYAKAHLRNSGKKNGVVERT